MDQRNELIDRIDDSECRASRAGTDLSDARRKWDKAVLSLQMGFIYEWKKLNPKREGKQR